MRTRSRSIVSQKTPRLASPSNVRRGPPLTERHGVTSFQSFTLSSIILSLMNCLFPFIVTAAVSTFHYYLISYSIQSHPLSGKAIIPKNIADWQAASKFEVVDIFLMTLVSFLNVILTFILFYSCKT